MGTARLEARWWMALLCLAVSGCGSTGTDAEFLLVGIWQNTVVGDHETTLQLVDDGTFHIVNADFAQQSCDAESGTWATEDGTLIVTTTIVNGQTVNRVQQVPFVLTGETLTITSQGGIEVLRRVSEMVDCASYGWGTP